MHGGGWGGWGVGVVALRVPLMLSCCFFFSVPPPHSPSSFVFFDVIDATGPALGAACWTPLPVGELLNVM